jgi:hypothetical protein
MKVEIISTQMVSNKKESHKKTDKKKHIVDKKGSIVQNNEAEARVRRQTFIAKY